MDGFYAPQGDGHFSSYNEIATNNDRIEMQLATSSRQLQIAYKIRHEAYLSYNHIVERTDGLFFDKYDNRKNVSTVLIYKGGVPAATVRVCLFDPTGRFEEADRVPALEIFDAEIRALTRGEDRSQALRAVEITRLARLPAFGNDKSIIHALFKAVGYLILHYQADIVLNACRPHHVPTYRRLGFRKIEEPRQYPNLTYKAALLACFSSNYEEARARLPFLEGISTSDRIYRNLVRGEVVPLDDDGFGHPEATPTVATMSRMAADMFKARQEGEFARQI